MHTGPYIVNPDHQRIQSHGYARRKIYVRKVETNNAVVQATKKSELSF